MELKISTVISGEEYNTLFTQICKS